MFNLSKTGTRFLIISLAVCLLGLALMVFVGVRFMVRSSQNQAEGLEFGRGKGQQACLAEALRRHQPTIDPTMQLAESAFIGTCLIASKPTEGFCDGVPPFDMLDQLRIAKWGETKCEEHGFTDGGCTQIFLQAVSHCHMSKYK